MYFIALQMLFGDRRKYVAIVIGITFSALIMTQQPSIFIGLLSRTYSFVNDVSLPDIWVMDPGVQFVEEHKPIRDTELGRIRGIQGVEWAVPMYKNLIRAKLPDGRTKTIDLTGLDDATLIGAPHQIIEGHLLDLRGSDAIFVDYEAARTRLRVKNDDKTTRALRIGDILEINDHRAIVAGYIKSTRNFVLQPQVYTTYSRALHYASPNRNYLTYVLVKAKTGKNLQNICERIADSTGLSAYTAEEFRNVNLEYWMKNTGIPINFGISVLLGFIVGAAVAGQTFFNFVQENLKHYAVLKSMGLENGILIRMVMLQAIVVGLIGYGIGIGLTALFGLNVHDSVLAFKMTPFILLFSAIGVGVIVLLSAFLGIWRVVRVDPATVFRG
ncbi:ftsX-like permease family protein [Caedimonas varicaedens]|uniref:FtsX-like permease family protein n=1 Tax=Caedimonas varicaedens TaxID=1629334 RepID=A0A0K8MCH6_9PROT|nr:ftsX-like permease family protein [Caedimonas varicaedens]